MKTEHELNAVEQNELMVVRGGDALTPAQSAAVQKLLDTIDHALSTLKNPDTWKGVQVYSPQ